MKKILLSAAALLTLLFAASCQKEDFSGADGEFATVTLTVQAPASPVTKAFGDGTTSNLRLDFGVFDENGEVLDALRQTDIEFGAADSEGKRSTTVKVNLAKGKTYHFICWAQDNTLACYNHGDLKAITVDYSKDNAANVEKRDAFYACVKSDIVTADHTQTITLTRPFAQLNVGSDDLKEAEKAGVDTTNLYVELSVTDCPNVLNADFAKQSYTVAGSVVATFTKEICPATVKDSERINVELNGTPKSYSWLSMNYIFTSVSKDDLKKVTFNLYEEGTHLVTYTEDNVPFQANWRTNLLGRLLTTDGKLTVVIDPNFANVHNIYLDAISQAALQTAIDNKVAGTYNVSGYVHAVAAVGTDQEKVTLKDDKDEANPTVTRDYTLSVVGLKSDDTFYQEGDYLVVSVTVDAEGEVSNAQNHVYHRPAKADDEEVVEPVTPKLSLAMEATEPVPVPADGGEVTVKVTSNVAWTLSLNGSKVAEGSEAVADHEVEVVVPANEETQEVTHTLVLSDVPAEGATATTKIVELKQAAAESEEPAGPMVVTVAEFLAAADDTTIEYQVSGTIGDIYQAYNSQYNNISFYITDATGEMLAFRVSCEGITDPATTITKGDEITVKGTRTLYNNVAQMAQGGLS
ncbi:MAG: BACON domain-containing protein [Bacteroidales bacterium]|nr:BACON domain-containing protein [Bacteroidales bacterium]